MEMTNRNKGESTWKVEEERQNVAALEEQNEKLREKLPLRECETEILKKYGFAVTAIVFAAGVTIGAVIGALTNALKKLGLWTPWKLKMEIEKEIASNNNNMSSFKNKWSPLKLCPSDK